MAHRPDPPFPKGRGNGLRATDWNGAVNGRIRGTLATGTGFTVDCVGSHRVRSVQAQGGPTEIRLTVLGFRWF